MSTRCRIGIKNEDGSIDSIYCHFDGYLSCVGQKLFDNYQTEEKIRKLLALGDISSLGSEPVDNPNAWNDHFGFDPFKLFTVENFAEYCKERHPDNMCDTYRSRGEECPAKKSSNVDEYYALAVDCWGDYIYLFENGEWKYSTTFSGMHLNSLKDGLLQEQKEDAEEDEE